jgi:hypothetical protein
VLVITGYQRTDREDKRRSIAKRKTKEFGVISQKGYPRGWVERHRGWPSVYARHFSFAAGLGKMAESQTPEKSPLGKISGGKSDSRIIAARKNPKLAGFDRAEKYHFVLRHERMATIG